MHTLKVILAGFGVLGACSLIARKTDPGHKGNTILRIFLPLWAAGAGANLYVGVKHSGYPLREEIKPFLVVFLVPACAAFVVSREIASVRSA